MAQITRLLSVAVAVAIGASDPIEAVDGVIEINQVRALSGGVTPGDSPGFPVTLSQSGSYVLTGTLSVPNADTTGIVVEAPRVTIELNGFGIEGPVRCSGSTGDVTCSESGSGIGIHAPRLFPPASTTGTTVRNGFVTGMGSDGISLQPFSHVQGVLAQHNADEGLVLGDDSLVTDSRIVLNRGDGLQGDASVSFRGCRIARVGGATVSGVTDAGGNTCDDQLCSAVPKRRYYLTRFASPTSEALDACDEGFHMASLFELIQPASLIYDTTRGLRAPDQGSGPPSRISGTIDGWVRTGYPFSNTPTTGKGNCLGWTSDSPDDSGTTAGLEDVWDATESSWPWRFLTRTCDSERRVWCVQDQY
ncbi:MAG: hypothetical protein QNK05_16950 [Myxococcota bacterium]|nr:hypothetical protein [Myxococcota bacterium]